MQETENITRVKKWGVTSFVVAAIFAGLFVSYMHYSVKWHREQQYKRGFDVGQKEAERDLKAGNAWIYATGEPESWKEYDPLSGLTRHAIALCIVTDYDCGREAGYNQAINIHIKRHGPLPNSRIKWSREILSPIEYMTRLDSGKVSNLNEQSGSVKCPSSKFSIQLFLDHRTDPSGKIMTFERLSLTPNNQEGQLICFPGGDIQNVQPVSIAWGPPESEILFVRYRWENTADVRECVAVLDLRTGLWLNYERFEK